MSAVVVGRIAGRSAALTAINNCVRDCPLLHLQRICRQNPLLWVEKSVSPIHPPQPCRQKFITHRDLNSNEQARSRSGTARIVRCKEGNYMVVIIATTPGAASSAASRGVRAKG
jgi:hypothetical protein